MLDFCLSFVYKNRFACYQNIYPTEYL